jgi:hypothetical protein
MLIKTRPLTQAEIELRAARAAIAALEAELTLTQERELELIDALHRIKDELLAGRLAQASAHAQVSA